MAQYRFTPKNPPKSGGCKKLWDWWVFHFGDLPDFVEATRFRNRGTIEHNGAPRFVIRGTTPEGIAQYYVDDPIEATKNSPDSYTSVYGDKWLG